MCVHVHVCVGMSKSVTKCVRDSETWLDLGEVPLLRYVCVSL